MTAVPCEMADRFSTVDDNQPSVFIQVVQGLEHNQQRDEITQFEEYKLGECTLELPPGLPKGSPIQVTYKYNIDQTLEVTAKGPDGRTAQVTIERQTLDAQAVAQAATDLQRLEVE